MTPSWLDLARRAAGTLGPEHGSTTTTATVAFAAIDGSRGAVHLIAQDGVSNERAATFSQAFSTECSRAGRPMRAVTRVRGAPIDLQLVPVNGTLGLAADVAEGEATLVRKLHVTRSIAAAQRLAEDSVLDIGQNVRGIFELARSHTGSLERLVGQYSQSTGGSDTIASTIESLGDQVGQVNRDLVARVHRQAEALEEARTWTKDIVRLGQSIADIASSARVLTFNARIESARLGDAGRGFAVIAQSIQDLATQIRVTNDAVGDLANNLARALPALGSEAQAMASDARTQLELLTGSLERVRTQFDATRTEAHASLMESTETAAQLEQRANGVIEKLQFQDRAHQMLEEARGQSEALLKLLGVSESEVDQKVLEQVGWLGRQLDGPSDAREAGSVELF